jgi:GT2 family glycosyltransferase
MQKIPLVSVIIITWNNKQYLFTCLEKLAAQTFCDFEVIIIDNGSSDGTLDGLGERYPTLNLKIERLDTNYGFAVANNVGARIAQGQWLALLNADAFPEPEWLERLLEVAVTIPNAFFASRQIQANALNILDGEGDTYHISGLVWRRNYGLPVRDKYEIEEIFSPCAAAALYPRDTFIELGGFDEDYFAYQEDVDLGFRFRVQGGRSFYVPEAVVYHAGSASTGRQSDFAVYHGRRNLIWTYIKNMPSNIFWLFLPLHLLANLFTFLVFIFTGHGKTILHAQVDALREIGPLMRKRKEIQGNRRVPITTISRSMEWDLLAPLRVLIQHRRFGSG